MSGSTFQPPIHLDPTQDPAQQTAFINQNFQSMATTLETNSFRIVSSGVTSLTPADNSNTWVTVPHNLGFAPIPFVYLTNVLRRIGSTTVTSNGNIPLPTFVSLSLDTVNHLIKFDGWFDCTADETNLYIFGFNPDTGLGSFNFQYYLVQQPAN